MKKTLVLVSVLAMGLSLSACKKKEGDKAKGGDAMKDMAAMAMTAEMDRPMEPDMRPADMDAMKAPDKAADNLATCKKLYADHYKKFLPSLAKLGINTTLDEVIKAYGADKPDRLKRCMSLTAEQLACAQKQPNPLNSRTACKHKKYLTMYVPSNWSKKISPEEKKLDEKVAKKLQKWLKGKWVQEDKRWKRKEVLNIKKDGTATGQRFKDGKKDGKQEKYVFSFKNELQIHRKWGTTTQTFNFFKISPKAFVMSGNLIYNVAKIDDKKNFMLKLGSSEVLLMKDGKCEVIDLSFAADYPATCKWGKDAKEKLPVFLVEYKPGKYPRKAKYFYVKKHLIHQYLWKYKYEKK